MTRITRLLPDTRFGLGEGPVWDDRAQVLYFVDIAARALHRLDPETGAHTSWAFDEKISCLGLTEGDGILVSGQSGLWLLNPADGSRALRFPIPALPADMRTNDGKVGPDGCFWVGTMTDSDTRGPDGFLMRIAPDGEVRVVLKGLTTPNGLGWSADGARLYYAETRDRTVDLFDVGVDGALSNRRRFADIPADCGRPDGAAFDAEGHYWVAGIDAGRVNRIAPHGRIASHVDLPTPMVTMPCFGGPDLRTVFVTSLIRKGADDPQAGGLFSFRAPVAGRLPHRFKIRGNLI
ncbi:SMP-30/gluconolactonase/LRE family protein [Aliigemmobacter aestuarii]|uniref:SMP-30/gluconolactonase/LRE family protein n=1 Tax=Aliigemmobacter aestuarii TaxID=1445661 RepID=A0A4S3MMR0_9RHOB|nr:SMP-30/gluconolactonase/LRE family protein [Gemmobacter aestuarii]THD83599.1 SMP-30/gluconolactonase/LRE family protein [Gemmobacter aestuarii]